MVTWDAMVVVGRVARPHGLRGDVVVVPETDFVEQRFEVGATVWARAGQGDEELTVRSLRVQPKRVILGFSGFERIEDVARLAGCELRVDEEALQPLPSGSYYQHQFAGCVVETSNGDRVGTVLRVEGSAGNVRLVVEGVRGEVLIPLTTAICTTVDIVGQRIEIEPPAGLLELNEIRHRHDLPENGRGGPRGGRRRSRR